MRGVEGGGYFGAEIRGGQTGGHRSLVEKVAFFGSEKIVFCWAHIICGDLLFCWLRGYVVTVLLVEWVKVSCELEVFPDVV